MLETMNLPISMTEEIESKNLKETIKLKNDQIYEFDDISVYDNIIKINFDKNVDMSSLIEDMSIFDSIIILTRSESQCGKYDGYNTIYKKDEEFNILMLSNDGSIYIEPEPIDPNPIDPEPVPPEPTLEEIKSKKITELSEICNFNIVHGVYMEIDGEQKLFSYKTEDQSNLLNALQIAIATQMSMPYHADGCDCRLFSPEEITQLYVLEMTNLTHNQTYTNQLKMYINTLETKEEITAISYGNELTGKYLETYNMIMEQSKLVIQKFLESLSSGDQNNTDSTKDETDSSETIDKTPNDNVEEIEVTK